jgi:hypothetical protein
VFWLDLRGLSALAAVAALSCGQTKRDYHAAPDASGDSGVDAAGQDTGVDAGLDASGGCDPQEPFSAPQLVPGVAAAEQFVRLSGDGLLMFYVGSTGLTVATRRNRDDLFAVAYTPPDYLTDLVTFVNISQDLCLPAFATDSLTVYMSWGGQGRDTIYTSTRPSTADPFPTPTQASGTDVGGGTFSENQPCPSGDGNTLYFEANGEIWSAQRNAAPADAGFAAPVAVGSLTNSANYDTYPVASADDLTLYFATHRGVDGGTNTDWDIWVTTRTTRSEPFGPPQPVTELNTSGDEFPGWISSDGCEMYLATHGVTDSGVYSNILVAKRPR